jgi:hypothetical protein
MIDHCLIDGACVEHKNNKTNVECQVCDVHVNVSGWILKDGKDHGTTLRLLRFASGLLTGWL